MRVGCGLTQKFRKEILQAMRVGVWATKFPISDNIGGPNIEATESQLTIILSWGGTTIKKYFSIEISISYAWFYSCIPILSTH